MWVGGPPNHIKDGIQPLTGLVETDWLPFPFTMNWMFTRKGSVRWERGQREASRRRARARKMRRRTRHGRGSTRTGKA